MLKQQTNVAAIYKRLSRDDGGDAESNSIVTQGQMLRRYAKEQGFVVYDEYTEMITTRLIQFNYSPRNFIFGCISWVQCLFTAERKMHPNAPNLKTTKTSPRSCVSGGVSSVMIML